MPPRLDQLPFKPFWRLPSVICARHVSPYAASTAFVATMAVAASRITKQSDERVQQSPEDMGTS